MQHRRQGRPAGRFNSATLLQPLHGDAFADALGRIEDRYDGGGHREVQLWSAWPTPDLRPRGWTLEGHPPLLVRPADDLDRPSTDHAGLVEATTPAALADWSTATVEGFPLEEVTQASDLLPNGLLDDRWRFVLAREDERAVAVGSQFVEHDLNLLVLAVTRPEVRGQGLYSAVAANRIAHRPDLPAAAIVSDDSRPVLVGRFGFLPVVRFTLWSRSRD